MSNDLSKYEFTPGGFVGPEEDQIYWSSGITAHKDTGHDLWLDRIHCYGTTREDAQALRDRVLYGLELVAAQEREQEMSLRATARMVAEGKLAVGIVHIGGTVLGAGLGSKGDD